MALSSNTYQFIQQLGATKLIDASAGVNGVVAFALVGANGWHNGQRLPHDIEVDLSSQKYDKQVIEGIEYYLVPEVSSNLPGRLAVYAQATGVADLTNPPGGGANRARDAHAVEPAVSAAPDAVAKFIEDNDAHEEARQKATEEENVVARAVDATTPGRDAEGKLVSDAPEAAAKPAAKKDA